MKSGAVVAVLPARLPSRRFPRKVLHTYRSHPLLYYVWNDICRSRLIDHVLIATDSSEIEKTAEGFGAEVVRTSKNVPTGSDRVAEAVAGMKASIIINVQADTFGLKSAALGKVIRAMQSDRKIKFATLARPILNDNELFDPNTVKVVTDSQQQALLFSRYPLPYLSQTDSRKRWRQYPFMAHIGVYFFRPAALKQYASWKQGVLEKAESLEQLRILENGGSMSVFRTKTGPISVDSPLDLKKLRSIYK